MHQPEKTSINTREIVDMTGRKVVVPAKINSVFAASMYGYTMLASIAPELIAATPFPPRECDKNYLHPHLHNLPYIEKITDTQAIAAVKPDVVLVWADKEQPFHKKSEAAMNELGIPFAYVIIGNLGDVPDFPAAYEFLGRLLDREDRCNSMAAYCSEALKDVQAVLARVPEDARPKVYYAEGEDGLMTEFDDSLHAHLLKLVGDVNVVRGHMTTHKGLEKVSVEQVAEWNPDLIVAWSRNFVEKAALAAEWKEIAAVRNSRIHAIPNSPFNWFDRPPCFMRILGLKWLTSRLYSEHYRIDMVEETRRFYSIFLGIEISAEQANDILAQKNTENWKRFSPD